MIQNKKENKIIVVVKKNKGLEKGQRLIDRFYVSDEMKKFIPKALRSKLGKGITNISEYEKWTTVLRNLQKKKLLKWVDENGKELL